MKHVAIDFHFIRDQIQTGSLRVAHVSSNDQLADALTKSLPRSKFHTLKTKIGAFLFVAYLEGAYQMTTTFPYC
jgi:1,2-phenylacetyl-CoA epoxidase catalytic subunit